ncbi:hypothetical protein ACN2AV_12350 [Lentilactobacillus buchneri subsp. silagei]|uniref:hypothetical protein n=1 Tax=Lentilactobacillus buchneri TaxID=1581 RepID=UPI003AFA0F2B
MKKQKNKIIEHIKSIDPVLSISFFITISLLLLTSLSEFLFPVFIPRLSQLQSSGQYSYILSISFMVIFVLAIFCYFSKDRVSNNVIFIILAILIGFVGIFYFLFYISHYYLKNINISLVGTCLFFSALSVFWIWGLVKNVSNIFFKILAYTFLLLFLGIITISISLFISKCIYIKNPYYYFSGIIASISIVITLSSSVFIFFKSQLNRQRNLIANARPIFWPNSSQEIKFSFMNNNCSLLKYVDAFYEKGALDTQSKFGFLGKESEQRFNDIDKGDYIIHEQLSHQKRDQPFSIKHIKKDGNSDYSYILKATDLLSEDIYFVHVSGNPDIHLFNVEKDANGNLSIMHNAVSNGIYKNYKRVSYDWKQDHEEAIRLIEKCFLKNTPRIEL